MSCSSCGSRKPMQSREISLSWGSLRLFLECLPVPLYSTWLYDIILRSTRRPTLSWSGSCLGPFMSMIWPLGDTMKKKPTRCLCYPVTYWKMLASIFVSFTQTPLLYRPRSTLRQLLTWHWSDFILRCHPLKSWRTHIQAQPWGVDRSCTLESSMFLACNGKCHLISCYSILRKWPQRQGHSLPQSETLSGRFYDPFGYLAPVVVQFKIFVRELCEAMLEWD